MKTRGALLWEPGTGSGWSVEEIELDPPKQGEVLVKLAASGICHSDDHFDTKDFTLPWAPLLGGHEGAGVVVELGPDVDEVVAGDHVVLTFLPSCGRCQMCCAGVPTMCELGAGVLSGVAPDGTHRIHARGKGVGAMAYLGTWAPYVVAPVASVVKIDTSIPLVTAALIGCGVPTGWGSAVYAADVQLGDTVIVVGTGGVGMNAVQGAVHKGASCIIAIDPVEFKREKAKEFGATHVAANYEEAQQKVAELTNGQGAERVIITVDMARSDIVGPALDMTKRNGVCVVTSAAPPLQRSVDLDLLTFTMSGKRLQGSLYGSTRPRVDIPLIIDMYKRGAFKLDELITRTYSLDDMDEAIRDLRSGANIRGVIVYDD